MQSLNVGLRTKIFLLMSFGIFTIYKGEEILNRSTTTKPHHMAFSKYRIDNPDPEIIQITGSLKKEYLQYKLRMNITSQGIIDPRTRVLTKKAYRYLADNNWWLDGGCACNSPVYFFVRNMVSSLFRSMQPMGRIVPMKEYWSEVYVSRTVITISHNDATLSSHDDGRISLLSQCNNGRKHMLSHIFEAWSGPINIAIYAKQKEFEKLLRYVSELLIQTKRSNIMIHIVISTGDVYPVNWLRNLVLKSSTSEYVFNIDIDFIPSKGLMDELTHHLKVLKEASANSTVLVVPALEMYDNSVTLLPLTKSELLPLIHSKQAGIFHPHAAGQKLFLIDKWISTDTSYVLPKAYTCDTSSEPYMVIKRTKSPWYPETLLERGKNKIAYYVELCTKGYTFLVIKNGFLFHKWHDLSTRATKRVPACVIHSHHAFLSILGKSVDKPHLFDPVIPWSLHGFSNGLYCMVFDYLVSFLLLLPFIVAVLYKYRRRIQKNSKGNLTILPNT